jgi:hypothetical protein
LTCLVFAGESMDDLSDDDAPFLKKISSPSPSDKEGFGISPEHISKLVQELEPEVITHKIPTLPRVTSPDGNPSNDNSNSSPSAKTEHLLSVGGPSSFDRKPHSPYPPTRDAQMHGDDLIIGEVDIPVNVGGVATQRSETQITGMHVGDPDSGQGIHNGQDGRARGEIHQNLDDIDDDNSDNDGVPAHLPSKGRSLAQLQAGERQGAGKQADGEAGSGQDIERTKQEVHALQQVLLFPSKQADHMFPVMFNQNLKKDVWTVSTSGRPMVQTDCVLEPNLAFLASPKMDLTTARGFLSPIDVLNPRQALAKAQKDSAEREEQTRLEMEARMSKVMADADEKLKQELAKAKLEVSLMLRLICIMGMVHGVCDKKNREADC